MPETIITEFDAVSIKNPYIKFAGDTEAVSFGGIGKVDGETELSEIVKKVEGVEVKKKTTLQKMTLKLSAHVPIAPMRKIFGLSNENLKPGVYAYGSDSKTKSFTLTADVIDEFEDITKLIAFPNCSSSTGLTLSIENGASEVAELQLEFTAMIDVNKKCYYEAIVDELEDPLIAETWRKNFNHDLVAIATP
ncbi:phage tail protein [Bacillus sp. FJAT-49736]|uniref:phage tail protein n=1 Tax=Bacillus sp. FJAT-49736 TaxID=2833582 RepID=UPI001BC98C74|nr:phage tail protein [Bacillus sp. FJAT-49736]MBS4171943.1 phage tail protein [Bacillus sp. FJAT-49736]